MRRVKFIIILLLVVLGLFISGYGIGVNKVPPIVIPQWHYDQMSVPENEVVVAYFYVMNNIVPLNAKFKNNKWVEVVTSDPNNGRAIRLKFYAWYYLP